ncbi:MAG: metallophosphoesterase family protein [Acidobacteria bacterium]|nr:metallophosphoesterase family protein [Acidobacteriota bacterium]
MLIGLISDTHSLIRAEATAALHGVELILHAGDVGRQSVLRELTAIAPTHAVFGNVDDPILGLPQRVNLTLGGLTIHVSHGHELGSPTPDNLVQRYPADVIVYGHTHQPLIASRGRTMIVNPGAAGPRRFNLQPSIGLLRIENGRATAEILPLEIA